MTGEGEETLWGARLEDFREATASAEPTPGGGSVAGVCATLGLGLVIMALEISAKRKDAAQPEEMKALIERGREVMAELSEDADRDVRAFRDYMAALKLPKESGEEKELRRAALQAASRGATEAPVLAARHMVEGLRLAELAEPMAHAHVVSDVGAGAGLLEGALTAVLLNVDVNLPSLSDAEVKAGYGEERAALARVAGEIALRVLGRVGARLGGK
jgi:formiminotetrahydrofolate cyclodeaminase